MIDLHAHILPELDDGAQSVAESLSMLRDAFAQGVRRIAATPHCHIRNERELEKFLKKRQNAFAKLQAAMQAANEPFPQILLGAEVAMNRFLYNLPSLHKLCITGTNCILLEPAFENTPEAMCEWIYEISIREMQPIIAHIDRYSDETLEKIGIYELQPVCQINAEAFLKRFGKKRLQKFSDALVVCVAGSDMHNMKQRKCVMEKAYKRAKRILPAQAEAIFKTNSEKLIG